MIAIIKGCGSNIASLQFSLQRLGYSSLLTDDVDVIQDASHVILPGVGHAAAAMKKLKCNHLDRIIPVLQQPVLGICLGMQLLYEKSAEGEVKTLGIIPGEIEKIDNCNQSLSIPHMGWNVLHAYNAKSLAANTEEYVYFVHSYAAPINQYTVMTTEYGKRFTAVVQKKNFVGMQFHPERSGIVGELLLKNFLRAT